MTDQSKMSNQKTLKDSTNVTSSQELEGGLTHSSSPNGIQTDLFGLEVAPVKVSQQQDNVKAQMTSVTFGHNGFASSESQDLQQSLGSRLLERLGLVGSMQSQQILKRVTTDLLRAYCQDTLLEPITVDKDYGSWPTPRTVDGTRGAVRLNKRGKRQSDTTGIEYGATLGDSVHTWPTPLTRDYKGGYQGGRTRNGHISTDTLDITAQLTGEQSNGSNVEMAKPARSRLNPMFSLWLMGYPKSWIQKAIPENTVMQGRSKE